MNIQVPDQPSLLVESHPNQPGLMVVTVCGLDPAFTAALGRPTPAGARLRSLLRVTVIVTGAPSGDDLPDMVGHYQILERGLRFTPYFPFEPGLSYRASFDPRGLNRPEASELRMLEFSIPKVPSALPTEVRHIYPSSQCLPENLLRFYIGFSNSMQRGKVAAEIQLLGPDGEPAPDVLYRAPIELWDRSMRFLTVLLDPGRLKRGVGPNRALGPPLRAGQVYTLAVGAGMLDCSGRRLHEPFYKRFRVAEAVREPIAVDSWRILPPVSQSRQALVLLFPRPLDWALLPQTITVTSTDGQSVDGRIVVDQCEQRWSFTPALAWAPGFYQIRVGSGLEDVCGNTITAAFDRPLRPGMTLPSEPATQSIPFQLA